MKVWEAGREREKEREGERERERERWRERNTERESKKRMERLERELRFCPSGRLLVLRLLNLKEAVSLMGWRLV